MYIETEQFIAMGDFHSELEIVQAVHESLDPDTLLIGTGDTFHGFKTPGTADLLIQNPDSIQAIAGNHDVMVDAALHAEDPDVRRYYIEDILNHPRYRPDMIRDFQAYGVMTSLVTVDAIDELSEKMPQSHKDLLHNLPAYVMTPSALLIHAGLTGEDWEPQQSELDDFEKAREQGEYRDLPPQLSGIGTMKHAEYAAYTGLNKLLINGHWHGKGTLSAEERIIANGKRVLLAPPRFVNYNFVYINKTHTVEKRSIHEVPAPSGYSVAA